MAGVSPRLAVIGPSVVPMPNPNAKVSAARTAGVPMRGVDRNREARNMVLDLPVESG